MRDAEEEEGKQQSKEGGEDGVRMLKGKEAGVRRPRGVSRPRRWHRGSEGPEGGQTPWVGCCCS